MAAEKKVQRIKLRMTYPGSPVKLDGTVTSMRPDGSAILVLFDGDTLGELALYNYGKGQLCDKENCQSAMQEKARVFDVL